MKVAEQPILNVRKSTEDATFENIDDPPAGNNTPDHVCNSNSDSTLVSDALKVI